MLLENWADWILGRVGYNKNVKKLKYFTACSPFSIKVACESWNFSSLHFFKDTEKFSGSLLQGSMFLETKVISASMIFEPWHWECWSKFGHFGTEGFALQADGGILQFKFYLF